MTKTPRARWLPAADPHPDSRISHAGLLVLRRFSAQVPVRRSMPDSLSVYTRTSVRVQGVDHCVEARSLVLRSLVPSSLVLRTAVAWSHVIWFCVA
jgi:hypothetical protein